MPVFKKSKQNLWTISTTAPSYQLWPCISHGDICFYLIHATNSITLQEMRAFKALEAHVYFTSGFVLMIRAKSLKDEHILIIGKVKHSFRSDDPLSLWILAKKDGAVVTAHCNCMAGFSESCSHVGAVFFAIEVGVSLHGKTTCTDILNQWLPTHSKKVPSKEVRDINFSSSKKRKINIDKLLTMSSDPLTLLSPNNPTIKSNKFECLPASKEKLTLFYKNMCEAPSKPSFLSLISPFNDRLAQPELPPSVSSLFKPEALSLPWNELLVLCEDAKKGLVITEQQVKLVQAITKSQSRSSTWFSQRAGRITASKIKSVIKTDPSSPSMSLIKTICYPAETKFTSAPTTWGITREKDAFKAYSEISNPQHDELIVSETGFVICVKHPFMGASPDGIIMCKCCGSGVLEIKCPFTHKNSTILEIAEDKNSCLTRLEGKISLDRKHAYYFQLQAQINICNSKYGDFVVWTMKDVHVERILKDEEFWSDCVLKAEHFFTICLLPELIGKWFSNLKNILGSQDQTNPNSSSQDQANSNSNSVNEYCFCRGPETSEMVACDNENCPHKWFHFKCLKINAPKSKFWYCPKCRPGMKVKGKIN